MTLRNVAVPAGDLYPNGLPHNAAPGEVQATVRPAGWLFRRSAGYLTVRPGKTEFQDGQHGAGIHFVPQRFAEDVGSYTDAHGYPIMVDRATAVHLTDLADLPGSDRLDDDGTLTPYEASGNRGVMLSDSRDAPVGSSDIRESERTLPDFGDRQKDRPITKATLSLFYNPSQILHEDYRRKPITSVFSAAAVVGVFYLLASNLEREFRSRRGSSAGGAVGAAAAAPIAASGATVKQATDAADRAAEAAGEATAAAGKAVKEVTDATSDIVKED